MRKAREKEAWEGRMAAVGRHQYVNVNPQTDLRLMDPYNPPRVWTDEETWQFITMDDTAAPPGDIVIKVMIPAAVHTVLD